ncbi:MAG: S24 family peptidase [Saprospiraceae bacterium]
MLDKQIHTIIEFLNDHNSLDILIENIDIVKNTLTYNIQHKLTLITSQIKRTNNSFNFQKIRYEVFEVNINKKVKAIISVVERLKECDILAYFSYNKNHNIVYYIYNKNGDMYEYKGDLVDGKPNGKGEITYSNGEKFIGNFENGKKHGNGEYYNRSGEILKKGNWNNDKFIEKRIRFYPSINIAAGEENGLINGSISNIEYFDIPDLDEENLIAFPIIGNSMEPEYYERDKVVCKEIKEVIDLYNNSIYIIYHNEELYLKILQIIEIDKKTIFRLSSINHEKHPPFDIIPNETTKVYDEVCLIRNKKRKRK